MAYLEAYLDDYEFIKGIDLDDSKC